MPDEINTIYKNPLLFTVVAGGWILSAILTYLAQTSQYRFDSDNKILDAKAEVVQLQARLEVLQNQEIRDVSPILQQFVNTFDTPAWIKFYDYEDQNFYFSVVNDTYAAVYGVHYISFGKTDIELYSERKLTDKQRATLLNYKINDKIAVRAGPGKCIVVNEYAYPVGGDGGLYKFKKCMIVYKTSTYVLGYQI